MDEVSKTVSGRVLYSLVRGRIRSKGRRVQRNLPSGGKANILQAVIALHFAYYNFVRIS